MPRLSGYKIIGNPQLTGLLLQGPLLFRIILGIVFNSVNMGAVGQEGEKSTLPGGL